MTKLQQYRELAEHKWDMFKNAPPGWAMLQSQAILDLLNRLEIAEKALKYYSAFTFKVSNYYGVKEDKFDFSTTAKEALEKIRGE